MYYIQLLYCYYYPTPVLQTYKSCIYYTQSWFASFQEWCMMCRPLNPALPLARNFPNFAQGEIDSLMWGYVMHASYVLDQWAGTSNNYCIILSWWCYYVYPLCYNFTWRPICKHMSGYFSSRSTRLKEKVMWPSTDKQQPQVDLVLHMVTLFIYNIITGSEYGIHYHKTHRSGYFAIESATVC